MKEMGMANELINVGFQAYSPEPLADQSAKQEGRMWV
jgi:hypothetical protein